MRFRRVAVGAMVALGLLGAIPGTVLAAQPTCGQVLTANTTLTGDLDCSAYAGDALTMGANRIDLNLNGYTISGWNGLNTYSGVDTDGYDHTTIRNGTIANFGIGVSVNYSVDTLVRNLLLSPLAQTDDYGVFVEYGAGNVLEGLVIAAGYDTGIYLEYSASNRVRNNVINGADEGVYAYYESGDVFRNNVVHSPGSGFYDYYSGNNRYVNNRANGGDYGFYLYCDTYGKVTLIGNTANDNTYDGFYTYYCYADNSSWAPGTGSVIIGNTAKRNDTGFNDEFSINATWTGNLAKSNVSDGFYLYRPAGSTVTWNVARGNSGYGFYLGDNLSSGYYNVYKFSYNTANYNDYGHYADNGAPGRGNVAHHSTYDNCYNVVCV